MNQITTVPTIADAKKALSRMLNGFHWGGDENEKKLKLDAYWDVLGGLSPNVVVAACAAAARGELSEDRRFPPTAASVYERAVSYLPRPAIKPLEPKRMIPPEERARVAAGMAELRKEFGEKSAAADALAYWAPVRRACGRWPPTMRPLSELQAEFAAKALSRMTK